MGHVLVFPPHREQPGLTAPANSDGLSKMTHRVLGDGLLKPAPLTGGLAGTAAIRRRTIKLAIGFVAVRPEEVVTAAALASVD